tara:strand:+ start:38 stop:538 length:501 start_codon:yes stop_codon:yes gene_type:complete
MAELTSNLNYLQPTGFKVIIDRENYPNLEYFVQSFVHPDISLIPSELPYRKVRNIPLPGGTLDFGELSMTIILDEDLKGYQEMHDWMRRIIDQPLKGALARNTTVAPSSADITLTILNSQNNKTKNIKYNEAVPTALGGISFEATAGGTEFLTSTMNFRFTTFELL